MAKVTIIGGGVAGIGAAVALAKAGARVSLFEAEPRLGGDCRGVAVSLWDKRSITVDAGVCEFNQAASPALGALFEQLNCRCEPVNTDVSFMTPERETVWFSRGGQPQFRGRIEDREGFLDDIRRFGATCHEGLDNAT